MGKSNIYEFPAVEVLEVACEAGIAYSEDESMSEAAAFFYDGDSDNIDF